MEPIFAREKILKSAIGPYDNYCIGAFGKENYITSLVLGFGNFEKTYTHPGSQILDKIVAFDKAEISEAYLGQINMTIVSSFCGPQGLIWGYDLAKKEDIPLPSFLPNFNLEKFPGVKIKNGENLRKASIALFGTKEKKHFPFLPGSHVPCAGRTHFKSGPATLYGTIAIGIPDKREKYACLLMEDVGEINVPEGLIEPVKQKLMFNAIKSVLEIGKNQNIVYKEIFVDFITGTVKSNEIGCILVAMPYFQLAKRAFNEKLLSQTLESWIKISQKNFLCNQNY